MTADKKAILALFVPAAVLKPATPEAAGAVPDGLIDTGYVAVRRFPFRVGRESRGMMVDGRFHRVERPRQGSARPNNDLYLIDASKTLQVSREHFQIERTADGYVVVDRGSTCGTRVGHVRIGADSARKSAPLQDGDRIGVGTDASSYWFTFILLNVPGDP